MTAVGPEEEEVQRAIELSLEEAKRRRSIEAHQVSQSSRVESHEPNPSSLKSQDTTTEMSPNSPTTPHKRNITDCIEELEDRRRFVELPRVGYLYGDTLVYIDAPAGFSDPSNPKANVIKERYSKPFRVRSANLKIVNSPVLNKMFTPDYQYRILRRRNLVNKLPVGVKYVLDLTPSIEGDDAVSLIMDLSCSKGVRYWALSLFRWNVSATLIGGADEFDRLSSQTTLKWLKSNRGEGWESAYEVPQDYTDLRHRAAIERVLLALEGQDPILDSAPKAFTTAIVASQQFGITSSPLDDYIVRWLRAEPNSNFIEALPEDTLRIAESIRCAAVCIDSFAVLVGEAALDVSSTRHNEGPHSTKKSLLQRQKLDLPESWQSRVEYARNAFVDRINSTFFSLIDEQMEWVNNMEELNKLLPPDALSIEYAEAYHSLVVGLKEFIRASILWIIKKDYTGDGMDADKESGGDILYPRINMSLVYNELEPKERPFMRYVWMSLRDFRFLVPKNWDFNRAALLNQFGSSDMRQQREDRGTKAESILGDCSFYQALRQVKSLVNKCYELSKTPPQPSVSEPPFTLPFRPASFLSASPNIEVPLEIGAHSVADVWNDDWEDTLDAEETEAQAEDEAQANNPLMSSPSTDLHSHNYPSTPLISIDFYNYFNASTFFKNVEDHIFRIAQKMLDGPIDGLIATRDGKDAKIALTRTLVCLKESETKFLPLWAGGLDDGTSGVFGIEVPFAEDGFTAPGHARNFGLGSSGGSSGFEMVGDEKSTIGTSTVVNDGYTDTMDRRRVVAASDYESVSGESITFSEAASQTHSKFTPAESVVSADNSEWEELTTAGGDDVMPDIQVEGSAQPITMPPRDPESFDDIFDYDTDEVADFNDSDNDDDFEDSDSYHGFDKDDMDGVKHESIAAADTSAETLTNNGSGLPSIPSRKGKESLRMAESDDYCEASPGKKRRVSYIYYKDGSDGENDGLMNRR